MGKLWSDLKNDKERIEFLRSGQAVNTGIMAPAIVPGIIDVYEFRNAQKKVEAPETIDNNGKGEICLEYEQNKQCESCVDWVCGSQPCLLNRKLAPVS